MCTRKNNRKRNNNRNNSRNRKCNRKGIHKCNPIVNGMVIVK